MNYDNSLYVLELLILLLENCVILIGVPVLQFVKKVIHTENIWYAYATLLLNFISFATVFIYIHSFNLVSKISSEKKFSK